MLVPEINLTPQLEQRFAARFPGRRLVSLHSALTPAQRLQHWLSAHLGEADLVLGTRLAVFASLPRLGLIVVDEEHDPSYKQQDGARYSARDLAVYRGHLAQVPVLLGSATPSLETWSHAQTGRYRQVTLAERVGRGALPAVRLLDMATVPRAAPRAPPQALAPQLIEAIQQRVARGEQTLLFLNRRGFAPVLHCPACTLEERLPALQRLARVPQGRAHPALPPLRHAGAGAARVPGVRQPRHRADGPRHRAARGAGRRAAARRAHAAHRRRHHARQGHAGVAARRRCMPATSTCSSARRWSTKGHDFRRVTLVAAVNPDSALFAADFRAPERLFALLMQAGGRAGRDADIARGSEMWVQTYNPGHALFEALKKHDFAAFATTQLAERQSAGLPPYSHLALLRAEAKTEDVAEAFLRAARALAQTHAESADVMFYAPVPPSVAKVAGFERRQMLIECASRATLQRLLALFTPQLPGLKNAHRGIVRWAIDVDPLGI